MMNAEKIQNLLEQINDSAAGIAEIANLFDPQSGYDAAEMLEGCSQAELEQQLEYMTTAFEALSLAQNGGSR